MYGCKENRIHRKKIKVESANTRISHTQPIVLTEETRHAVKITSDKETVVVGATSVDKVGISHTQPIVLTEETRHAVKITSDKETAVVGATSVDKVGISTVHQINNIIPNVQSSWKGDMRITFISSLFGCDLYIDNYIQSVLSIAAQSNLVLLGLPLPIVPVCFSVTGMPICLVSVAVTPIVVPSTRYGGESCESRTPHERLVRFTR